MGAVILAGGRSRRMGRDKASVTLNGRRLIELVIAAAREAGGPVVVVGGHTESADVVPDRYPGEGPLGGLITGLDYLGPGTHFALACDMPFVTAQALLAIKSFVGDMDAAVPEVHGKLHPLCAAYQARSADNLRRVFDSGVRSIVRALERIKVNRIPEQALRRMDPELRFLTNINTPADLENALSG